MTDDYTIRLAEVFHGPMDLLLHLVREQEVEIHEVELSQVIDGYFEYLTNLEQLEIEVAGDFLVMAATLMAIKSRSLLPREEVELEDELNPEDELLQRLIDYRRFRAAADDLEVRRERRSHEFSRGHHTELADHVSEITLELGELTAWDLLGTFSRLLRETAANRPHMVRTDNRPLRWFVSEVGKALRRKRSVTMIELIGELDDEPTKESLIGAFCALLELMRLGVVTARQETQDAEIEIHLREEIEDDLDSLIRVSRFMDEEDGETAAEASAEPEAVQAEGEAPPAPS